jgi:large subunit ribosomal protein L3
MSIGLLGKKMGMTQVYDDKGVLHPVTVVVAGPCTVLQKKDAEKDKYTAVQLGFEDKKESRSTKPELGHAKKANAKPSRFVREFRTEAGEDFNVGDKLTVTRFQNGQLVDVIGISKGKGFLGVVGRWKFAGGGAAHGSKSHRRAGAIGERADPGHIFKNHKMPGHTGRDRITVQNLKIVNVRESDNVLLIQGAVPGANGDYVVIRPSVKKKAEKKK